MKKAQKVGFLRPIRSIITLAKEKEKRNRKREEEERRRIKTTMIALLAQAMLATFFRKKTAWRKRSIWQKLFQKSD